jgi:hypothetical protein
MPVIEISDELLKALSERKIDDQETDEEIIWDALEDRMQVNEETKKDTAEAKADI